LIRDSESEFRVDYVEDFLSLFVLIKEENDQTVERTLRKLWESPIAKKFLNCQITELNQLSL
jgi:hypothetical protein